MSALLRGKTEMKQVVYHIFFSYARADSGIAQAVERAFADAGLPVFSPNSTIQPGRSWADQIRSAIVECDAFVVLITPLNASSVNLGIELGAAMSWHKPIYVLLDGVTPAQLPVSLAEQQVYSVADVQRIIDAVRESFAPLNESERLRLISAYSSLGMPTDALLADPLAIEQLAGAFNHPGGRQLSGERLAKELLRLRKGGTLPRLLRDRRRVASA